MSEYDRGLLEGKLQARLDDHGRRLDTVNGSIAETGSQLRELVLQMVELTAAVRAQSALASEGERARIKYVPIIEELQRNRIAGVKRWHVVIAIFVFAFPQTVNLLFHFF